TRPVEGRVLLRRGCYMPRTGHKASSVPVPDARSRLAVRQRALELACRDGSGLPNVGANGSDGERPTTVGGPDELPRASREAEDRPAVDPARARSERYDHGLASRADERPAK